MATANTVTSSVMEIIIPRWLIDYRKKRTKPSESAALEQFRQRLALQQVELSAFFLHCITKRICMPLLVVKLLSKCGVTPVKRRSKIIIVSYILVMNGTVNPFLF